MSGRALNYELITGRFHGTLEFLVGGKIMWWKKKETKKPKTDWKQEAIKELRAFRGLGETFIYMGREIVVTGHFDQILSPYYRALIPELRGDYVDDKGQIHQIKFGYRELETLKKQNPYNEIDEPQERS